MAIAIKREPFGQVEPNHLSAQRNGQVYAQLPVSNKKTDGVNFDINVLENGQFVKYDYENGEVNFTGDIEWFLVLNEVKLYREFWQESYKDYAMQRKNYTEEGMTPRVFKTMVGDIFTTNTVADGSYKIGDKLVPGATGILEVGSGDMEWTVVAETTMPDMSPAVKIQRTK